MALDAILQRTRADVARRMAERPLATFASELGPSDRSLAEALDRPHTGFILECKKASPSLGVIRANFDPVDIARNYEPFADAISVLTDAPHFQGSFEYLRAVRATVSAPVLCKDFVVDPYQIYEARSHGADAILLMCSVLSQPELETCLRATRELAMDALVEVHDAAELERALATDARIIGINNRNLKTLAVDLSTAEKLCPKVPADRLCIAESGITERADVLRLRRHCDAFLIGGHLMAAPDLGRAIRDIVVGRVKICGLTRSEDARAAHRAGSRFGGVMCWSKSKRHLELERADALVQAVPLEWVGVFVDEAPATVAAIARRLRLAAVQLHGDEPPELVAAVKSAVPPGCAVWKAERVGPTRPLRGPRHWGADRVVADCFVEGEAGGTGKRFDWSMFADHADHAAMILSGGITPHNAALAEAQGGFAIDLASGVESAPGLKDHTQLAALFESLRGVGRKGAAA